MSNTLQRDAGELLIMLIRRLPLPPANAIHMYPITLRWVPSEYAIRESLLSAE